MCGASKIGRSERFLARVVATPGTAVAFGYKFVALPPPDTPLFRVRRGFSLVWELKHHPGHLLASLDFEKVTRLRTRLSASEPIELKVHPGPYVMSIEEAKQLGRV